MTSVPIYPNLVQKKSGGGGTIEQTSNEVPLLQWGKENVMKKKLEDIPTFNSVS
jgi:hypothetical protein